VRSGWLTYPAHSTHDSRLAVPVVVGHARGSRILQKPGWGRDAIEVCLGGFRDRIADSARFPRWAIGEWLG